MFGIWLPILLCMSLSISGQQPPEPHPAGRAIENNSAGNVLSDDSSCEAGGEVGQCMMEWQCMQQRGRHTKLCKNRRLFGTCCIISNETTELINEKPLSSADIQASSKIEDLDHIAEFIADFASGIISSSFENGFVTNPKVITEMPNEPEQPEEPKRLGGNRRKKPNNNRGNRLIADDPLRTGEACGLTKILEGRIVNGTDVTFGEFPWQVSIRARKIGSTYFSHHCGGTMITKTWVATAAHCLEHIPSLEMIKLRIGEHDLAREDEKYPYIERTIKRKVVHPKFDFSTFKNDIALLELNEPVRDQPNIGIICLPGSDNGLNGLKGWATGWGRLQDEGPLPNILQKVPLTIMKNKECKASFKAAGRVEAIPKIFLCAADDGKDACAGDSGGPLQIQDPSSGQWFLGGIVSWGIGCARPNHPGVYTRISKFMPFIQKNIFKHS